MNINQLWRQKRQWVSVYLVVMLLLFYLFMPLYLAWADQPEYQRIDLSAQISNLNQRLRESLTIPNAGNPIKPLSRPGYGQPKGALVTPLSPFADSLRSTPDRLALQHNKLRELGLPNPSEISNSVTTLEDCPIGGNYHGTRPTCPPSGGPPGYNLLSLDNFTPKNKFSPTSSDPNLQTTVSSQPVDDAVIAAALKQADQTINYYTSGGFSLDLLTLTQGGNWNQFLGATPYPSGVNASFGDHDSLFNGINNSSRDASLISLTVLGYDPSSPYSFGTQFLINLNNLYSPWLPFEFDQVGGIGAMADLSARYRALDKLQLALYYTDPALSNLRSESNRILLGLMYADPTYLYGNYELSNYLEQIYTSRPTYPALYNLAQEMATWDSPPINSTELADRYQKRSLLQDYSSQVQFETLLYLYATPGALNQVNSISLTLAQRLGQNWNSAAALVWYANWRNRWNNAYIASPGFNNLVQQNQQLNTAHPSFKEYVQSNDDVINLIPAFRGLKFTQNIANEISQVFANQVVSQDINQYYNQYTDRLDTLLAASGANLEIERYNEQVNGLVYNDPTYADLSQVQYLVLLNMFIFQKNIHDAVANCLAIYGTACNPATDPAVLQLYNQTDLNGNNLFLTLMNASGLFYELYNQYWYDFYTNNPAYQALETNANTKIQTALAPAADDFEEARLQFNNRVANIPQVKHLYDNMNSLVAILRNKSPELDNQLSRMTQIATQLEGQQIYLPVILSK